MSFCSKLLYEKFLPIVVYSVIWTFAGDCGMVLLFCACLFGELRTQLYSITLNSGGRDLWQSMNVVYAVILIPY